MPLTELQRAIARLLSRNRSPDSHLAGGAALHFSPNSERYSNDLDYFQDSEERVASAFQADRALLEDSGYTVHMEVSLPAYLRAVVGHDGERTKIEWAHDSAWRFMPAVADTELGYRLHRIDVAVNKVLALAGRNEARDLLDVLFIDRGILPLGPLCWAAVGKDPGFNPLSLLERLKRTGRHQPEDFAALSVTAPVDLKEIKDRWLGALERAEAFIRSSRPEDAGCLYYSRSAGSFVDPSIEGTEDAVPHFGRPGGVLPRFYPGDTVNDA